MTKLLLVLNLSLHGAFIWGRYAVFRAHTRTPLGTRVIEVSALVCIVSGASLIAKRNRPDRVLELLAVTIAIFSGALFAWGVAAARRGRLTHAFSEDVPTELITAGPFRFVRNPFYLSYILAYFQALLASSSLWAAIPLAWMAALYLRAARVEEKKFLASPLGGEYRRYAAQTGRFLPFQHYVLRYCHAIRNSLS